MQIDDRLKPAGTTLHWAAFALSSNAAQYDEWVSPSTLYERTGEAFGDPGLLSEALHELAYERNLADTRPDPDDPNATQYRLKSAGRTALKRMGKPESISSEMAEAKQPEPEELVEAATGEMVEFSHVLDDGRLQYVGPHPEDGKDVFYVADSRDEKPEIHTIDLSPDWEWLGAQLYKLGDHVSAKRAFNEDLTPAEVYGPILTILDENKHLSALDFGNPLEDGLALIETPVDPDELAAIKSELGIEA